MNNKLKNIPSIITFLNKDEIIKNTLSQKKAVIIGGQSINAQIGGVFARPTNDYDAVAKNPQQVAVAVKNKLNKTSGSDDYYVQPSVFHPVTKKVYWEGWDGQKRTSDDVAILDVSPLKKGLKTTKVGGLTYVSLSETIKDKERALRDKQYEFRHKKDKGDIDRIKLSEQIRGAWL